MNLFRWIFIANLMIKISKSKLFRIHRNKVWNQPMSISNEFNIQQFTNDKWSCWSNKQSRFFFGNSRRITNGTTWIAISFSITIRSPLTKQRIKSTRNPPGESISLVQNNGVGDSDVDDIVMLVTLWWWLVWDVGGRIIMLATFFVMLVIFSMY